MTPLALAEHDALADRPKPRSTARVLHLINGEHYAGAERVQDLLGLRLSDWGFEVGFACMKPGQFLDLREATDKPLYEVPMRAKWDLGPVWQIARLLRTHRYALLHTHTARSALIGRLASRLAGVPMVHHVHSPAAAETTHRWRNRVNAASERFSVRGAAAVIAVSSAMADYARSRGIPDARLSVVHNGVPIPSPLADRPRPDGTWTLGTVALFRPRKGLEVLLQALAELQRSGVPVRLRAVGAFESPDYQRHIHKLAGELGVAPLIEWRGFARHVERELQSLDLFVLPSLFGEGLPMVVLEAMASGVPVVATRVSGTPEAVREGVDGLLATPGDPASLAAAMRRFVTGQEDWQAMRASARARQEARFSDRSMAEGVAAVYRKVLG